MPLYRVLRVEDSTALLGNTYGRVKRVFYQLYDGSESFVDVAPGDYTAAKVEQLVKKAAEAHADVMMLEGPAVPLPAQE